MDGNREGPQGKSAENWSRRDGIRAGAVSGPWRSGPRDEEPPPVAEASPATASARHSLTPPRRVPAAAWIVAAMLGAVAIAATALLMRPGAPPIAAADPAPALPAPAQAQAPPPRTAGPALQAIGRVRLRISGTMASGQRDALVAALKDAGVDDVAVEALPFEPRASRVGYYREADRAKAEELARFVAPRFAADRALPVRDYGALLDDPEPGRLDLWIGD